MSAEEVPVEGPPPKQDPEGLALRARPRPVVRFRRGVIVGAAALGCGSLVAIAWFALEPPSFHLAADPDGSAGPDRKASPEALANAPSTYGDVPALGPPLPGDLGRPILDHERSLREPPVAVPGPNPDAQLRTLEAERKAARESGLMVQVAARAAEGTGQPMMPAAVPPSAEPDSAGSPVGLAASDPNGQQRKLDFSRSGSGDTNPHALVSAASPWMLAAGTIIPASLVTGLDSDLPGMVVAQVSEPVFDSVTGRTILIPQGARLIGSYDSVVAFGQRRALLVWQRILFPDGASIRLDNVPASDLAGYSGLEDRIDRHSWQLLKGVALSTLLGVGTEVPLGSGGGDLVRAIREATQRSAANAGNQMVSKSLDVQPTIRVRPGWPVRAILNKDLVLRPWKELSR